MCIRDRGIENPSRAEVPPIHLLKEAEKHTDINNLIINEADSTVYLADPYMSLDVGAIAKGYATEKVSLYAKQHEFTSGVISVGGNVRAIGNKIIDRQPWNIGVQNPDKESKQSNLVTVHLNDMSLVTSGSYERYYTAGGKKYHHIIDPLTLFPAEYITSVTILLSLIHI